MSRYVFLLFLLSATLVWGAPYGINAHVPSDEVLDEIVELGVRWIRIDFIWAIVETEEDIFDWALYDDLIAAANERQILIFATISGTPQWATDSQELSGPPSNPEQWQKFCSRAAYRYRGRIAAWSFWNEPNLRRFWLGTLQQYIDEILIPAATAIREADPAAMIGGPGLAHLSSGDWEHWLRKIVSDHGGLFDMVTHHCYPSAASPNDVIRDLVKGSSNPWGDPSVRSVLANSGWSGRPVWLTETGAESDIVGMWNQSTFYSGLLWQWFGPNRSYSWLDKIFFYHIHDDPRFPDINYGILEAPPELTRKGAFYVYADFIRSTPVFDARFEAVVLPHHALLASTVDVEFTIRNTGSLSWEAGEIRLNTTVERPVWIIDGGELPDGSTVRPGDEIVIPVRIKMPNSVDHPPVSFELNAQMQFSDGSFFGHLFRRPLMVTAGEPPSIAYSSSGRVVEPGKSTTILVIATGEGDFSYQWRFCSIELEDDNDLSGATSPVLMINNFDYHSAGQYRCEVSNKSGSTLSNPILLGLASETGPDSPPRHPGSRRKGLPMAIVEWLSGISTTLQK